MAEVHIIGQIAGASEFENKRLFCKWAFKTGGGWKLLKGLEKGQTQTNFSEVDDCSHWNHLVDLHYATNGLQGWPKLHLQVWSLDDYGRSNLQGYAYSHMPFTPGLHHLQCPVWKPVSTAWEELAGNLMGGGLHLKNPDMVYNGAERFRLRTRAMGKVHLKIQIITRHFDKYGVEC